MNMDYYFELFVSLINIYSKIYLDHINDHIKTFFINKTLQLHKKQSTAKHSYYKHNIALEDFKHIYILFTDIQKS